MPLSSRRLPAWQGVLATIALIASASAAAALVRGHLAMADAAMMYLVAIVVAAARFGRSAALLASSLSVLSYNFLVVPPVHTFAVADERHLLTFITMFVAGLLVSALMERLRRHRDEAVAAELRARTEEMRSSLLSAVSHDLRTPLAAITGAATTLRDGGQAVGVAQRAELLEAICEEAERLERFVVNLLEMTRLQSGAVEVRREWVPVEELVGSALTRLEAHLVGRPVRTDLAEDLPLVSVDPVLMQQLVFNLVDNAAKHTPAGTPVEIVARADGAGVVIEVSDRGPGLPPGAEARVFEKFYRASREGVRGAGLGLAICKGIVAAHGGAISAAHRPGGGASFRVTLPRTGEAPHMPIELDDERPRGAAA